MSNQPPIEVPQGAIRLNTDSQKLEFFAQDRWYQIATEDASPIAGRGIWGGGLQGPYADPAPYSTNIIDMVQIQTRGNSVDFGDTTMGVTQSAGCGDRTRGLFMGGYFPVNNSINFITFATQGDSQDFGDTLQTVGKRGGFNNSTRGVVAGGGQDAPSPYGTTNVTEFVTIQSTGNAQDFGDLTVARDRTAGAASPTRGVIFQGYSSPSNQAVLDFFTTASTGNAVDFGDPTNSSSSMGDATSNNIRGLYIGGGNPGVNTLDEITFSTTGNAIEFGDMPLGGRGGGGAADATRAVMGRGISDTNYNNLFFVTIATRGNAMDFGDLTIRKGMAATTSNTNGGL